MNPVQERSMHNTRNHLILIQKTVRFHKTETKTTKPRSVSGGKVTAGTTTVTITITSTIACTSNATKKLRGKKKKNFRTKCVTTRVMEIKRRLVILYGGNNNDE